MLQELGVMARGVSSNKLGMVALLPKKVRQ